ncbi:MAG: hypothetical protein ACI8S3_002183 [Alphaproteobacteria bacterium]
MLCSATCRSASDTNQLISHANNAIHVFIYIKALK